MKRPLHTKEYLIARDLISKYHPEFLDDNKMSKLILKIPDYFNITKLSQDTIGIMGNILLPDGVKDDHMDYSDLSDHKSIFVSRQRNGDCQFAKITAVYKFEHGRKVSEKMGALRLSIANQIVDECHFAYVPKYIWATSKCPPNISSGALNCTYSIGTGKYSFEGYDGVLVTKDPFEMANYQPSGKGLYLPKSYNFFQFANKAS